MYLKSLEIQGFKSFPDKISLTFDKGLTAVVGPNGSGKSNIGDSVRWVLGEQSTKTLRGNKMEDVIFSGTVARKPMGFAAVTLNIDNSDRKINIMADEIAVTRKLYRSGESEYSINGRSCRLKDINELFMDTGLGRDGYSIIGQGRIAEIVGAKSNERRDIFEEAAGISKFRYRKLEAERKLSSAQENLVRLTDILSELESRVEPLKNQAQKAEKFLKLAEERKKLEISVWINRLDELKEKQIQLDEKILAAKGEYNTLESDIQRQEEKSKEGFRKMQECTMRSDELRRKMIEEEQISSEKKANIAVYENDIKHCEETVKLSEKSIADSAQTEKNIILRKENLIKKLDELKIQKKNLENEIKSLEKNLENAENKNSLLGNEVRKASDEINSLNIKQSELRFAVESAKKTIAEENSRLEELRRTSDDSGKLLSDYLEKLLENTKILNENQENSKQVSEKLKNCMDLLESEKQNFEKAKTEFESIIYELKDRRQRRKILNDLENNMEGFIGSVKQILKASRHGRLDGVCGTVAQNISVEPKYAVAIETALGNAMQNIIVENENNAKDCIRFLKEQKGGRATFLPITSINGRELYEQGLENCRGFISSADKIVGCDEKFRGIISNLLGRTSISENIDTAAETAKKYNYKFKIVTLDGQVINAGGSFTGGSAQKSGGIITRKNEIEKLDADIERLSAERDGADLKTAEIREKTDKLRLERENLKKQLAEYESDSVRLNAEISSLESLIGQINSQSENSEKFVADSEKKISESKKIISESEKLIFETESKISQAEKILSQGQKNREELRLERAELSEKISLLKIKNTEILKDCQSQELEISRADDDIKAVKDENIRLEQEIKNQNNIIIQKKNDIEKLKQELSGMKSNTQEYLEQINRYQRIHTEQTRLVNEIKSGLKTLNEAKEKLSGEINRITERNEIIIRDSDEIISQIREVYNLSRSEAAEISEKLDDMNDAQRRLREVKGKISALGSVNVGAIDEYREVSERYKFMSSQIKDVQKSKAELENIISGLTDDMCRIFSESFAVINKNFREIFTELFGGGEAELILTDPENVLESGIEIRVAPPGKVIKNLISLSGGEQAFIAIAIYFAILKLRPAPFCILDEIDAALDEVNVRKYAQYLKNFTDTTQFVLVTHRRSAMEEANVLYGVTMQEDGISKLLKLEVEQVDFQEEN